MSLLVCHCQGYILPGTATYNSLSHEKNNRMKIKNKGRIGDIICREDEQQQVTRTSPTTRKKQQVTTTKPTMTKKGWDARPPTTNEDQQPKQEGSVRKHKDVLVLL